MISKPLFKQSCKANAGIWTFVTAVTCFMLAIIIIVLGNLNVNEIRSSMTDMFVSDAIESTVEEQSMTYYNISANALQNYQDNYDKLNYLLNVQMLETRQTVIASYKGMIEAGMGEAEARQTLTEGQSEQQATAINTLISYYLVKGEDYSSSAISSYVLNQIADVVYDQILNEQGEEVALTAKTFIQGAINKYVEDGATDTKEFATSYIPNVIKQTMYDQSFDYDGDTIYISKYFTQDELHDKSYSAIVSYRAQMSIKESEIKAVNPEITDEELNQQLNVYSASLIKDLTKTLVDSLPKKVSDSLNEIGNIDVYGLVIGSIFYRIAGLLLPMIFVIMTANNLIAGQVDSGSMAYVLSTPTKRRKVTITQMCYLICSLIAMFALEALTSVVCLAIIGKSEVTITYGQLLLLNLGSFITMFAVSGICFLASSWFNRSKMSMSVGGGLTMFFLVATILGLFGSQVIPSAIRIDAMKYFNYVSIISLFDATSILAGSLTYLWKFAILIVIGVVCYFIGIKKFDKKDLPL